MSELFQMKILEAFDKLVGVLCGIQAELAEMNEYMFEIAEAQYEYEDECEGEESSEVSSEE